MLTLCAIDPFCFVLLTCVHTCTRELLVLNLFFSWINKVHHTSLFKVNLNLRISPIDFYYMRNVHFTRELNLLFLLNNIVGIKKYSSWIFVKNYYHFTKLNCKPYTVVTWELLIRHLPWLTTKTAVRANTVKPPVRSFSDLRIYKLTRCVQSDILSITRTFPKNAFFYIIKIETNYTT